MIAKGDDDVFIQPRMALAMATQLLQLPPKHAASAASVSGGGVGGRGVGGRGVGGRGVGGRGAHRGAQHIFAGVFEWCARHGRKASASTFRRQAPFYAPWP